MLKWAACQSIKRPIAAPGCGQPVAPKDLHPNDGEVTAYNDRADVIRVNADIFPNEAGTTANSTMSPRAALAHEYYGHRSARHTPLEPGTWNDELRASFRAARDAPGLTSADRAALVQDALERGSNAMSQPTASTVTSEGGKRPNLSPKPKAIQPNKKMLELLEGARNENQR